MERERRPVRSGRHQPPASVHPGLRRPNTTRTRFVTSFDVRSQTEYGTLRSYGRGGWQWSTGDYQTGGSQGASTGVAAGWTGNAIGSSSSSTYFDRAFVQFAGFTFGKTQSFYDFFNTGAYSNQTSWLWMDTGGSGTPVFAYTAQFGNGLSATISAEDVRPSRRCRSLASLRRWHRRPSLTPSATYVAATLAFVGITYSYRLRCQLGV